MKKTMLVLSGLFILAGCAILIIGATAILIDRDGSIE
jgi:hypothetical protein